MRAPLYITDTAPGGGKTVVTLGLISELGSSFDSVGFIKPVGLARVRAGHDGIDIDAMLVDKVCQTRANIKDMSPVNLTPEAWPQVSSEEADRMLGKIRGSFEAVSSGRDVTVIEGTGQAAFGNLFGLSNARVARELGARVLLTSAFSDLAKNAFDMVELNRGYFESKGVSVLGAIVNRVPSDALESYSDYARDRFAAMGLELFGIVPEDPGLKTFHFLQVSEVLDGEMIAGEGKAERMIGTVRVGAMVPHRALQYFQSDCLVITPGDREDVIVAVCAASGQDSGGPCGLVLTGGIRPHERILALLKGAGLPVFLAREDSYTVASKIHDIELRIQPNDGEKIARVQSLVSGHVEVDRIIAALEG